MRSSPVPLSVQLLGPPFSEALVRPGVSEIRVQDQRGPGGGLAQLQQGLLEVRPPVPIHAEVGQPWLLQVDHQVAPLVGHTLCTHFSAACPAHIVEQFRTLLQRNTSHNLFLAPTPDFEKLHRAFLEAFQQVLQDKRQPQEALDSVVAMWNEEIDKASKK